MDKRVNDAVTEMSDRWSPPLSLGAARALHWANGWAVHAESSQLEPRHLLYGLQLAAGTDAGVVLRAVPVPDAAVVVLARSSSTAALPISPNVSTTLALAGEAARVESKVRTGTREILREVIGLAEIQELLGTEALQSIHRRLRPPPVGRPDDPEPVGTVAAMFEGVDVLLLELAETLAWALEESGVVTHPGGAGAVDAASRALEQLALLLETPHSSGALLGVIQNRALEHAAVARTSLRFIEELADPLTLGTGGGDPVVVRAQFQLDELIRCLRT